MPKIVADYVVSVDVFHCDIGIYEDREQASRVAKSLGGKRIPKTCDASMMRHTDKKGVTWYLAWIPKRCTVDTIAHECVHLASAVLHGHDVKISWKDNEPLAYLTQYILRRILIRRAEIRHAAKKPSRRKPPKNASVRCRTKDRRRNRPNRK